MYSSAKLLVSVRSAAETKAALAGGADWIDLKEPARGALGAVDRRCAAAVAEVARGTAPLSAAAGELLDWPGGISRELLSIGGIELMKLGLANCCGLPWDSFWLTARAEIESAGKRLALVAYADADLAHAPTVQEVVRFAKEVRAPWMLVDTFDKSAKRLVEVLGDDDLRRLAADARASGVQIAVAGRLDLAAIAALPLDAIDMVAVRGAACDGSRLGPVSEARVAEVRLSMHRWIPHENSRNSLAIEIAASSP